MESLWNHFLPLSAAEWKENSKRKENKGIFLTVCGGRRLTPAAFQISAAAPAPSSSGF